MAEAGAPIVPEGGGEIFAFLGVPADKWLLDEDPLNLPDAEQHREPVLSSQRHDRLVAAGSLLTVARAWTSNPTHVIQPWPDLRNHLGVSREPSLQPDKPPRRSVRPLSRAPADNPCDGRPTPEGLRIRLPSA